LRPTVAVHDRGNARKFIEAGFEQQTTGTMFMLAWSVARWSSDENDFLIGCGAGEYAAGRKDDEQGACDEAVHFGADLKFECGELRP
jgi:hypothetical protein